jgi:hypothetical protein
LTKIPKYLMLVYIKFGVFISWQKHPGGTFPSAQ